MVVVAVSLIAAGPEVESLNGKIRVKNADRYFIRPRQHVRHDSIHRPPSAIY